MTTILGPTASGKTALAVAVAAATGGEIISGDSRQVYRGMDIGTGKDLDEYRLADGSRVPAHLIDIADAGTRYNLFRYQQDFADCLADIRRRKRHAILCGGTGLYIEAAVKGYALSPVPQNPALRRQLEGKTIAELTAILAEWKARNGAALHNTTDTDSPARAIRAIEIEMHNAHTPLAPRPMPAAGGMVFGVSVSRQRRRERITLRLKDRLHHGLIEEIQRLIGSGIDPEDLIYYGLEYKYVTEYVLGRRTYDDMFSSLETAIHQFAKRQMTWFRGMERRGTPIHWIDGELPMAEKVAEIVRHIRPDD